MLSVTVPLGSSGWVNLSVSCAGWKSTPPTLVEPDGSNCLPHAEASTSSNVFVLGFQTAESTLMHSRTLLCGASDSDWDRSFKRHQMSIVCVLCGRSADYVGSTQADRLGPRRVG